VLFSWIGTSHHQFTRILSAAFDGCKRLLDGTTLLEIHRGDDHTQWPRAQGIPIGRLKQAVSEMVQNERPPTIKNSVIPLSRRRISMFTLLTF